MVFEAWEEYWRQTPGVKTIIVKGIGDPATRLAGLLTGELDLAYGMTGKVLSRVMRPSHQSPLRGLPPLTPRRGKGGDRPRRRGAQCP
jgi:ABC-type transport system substrate-binding protein